MKELWIYIAVYLAGGISGIILWEKIGVDDVYRGKFKFKQSGKGNRQDGQINLDMGKETPNRLQRKLNRIDAKKQIKAIRKRKKV